MDLPLLRQLVLAFMPTGGVIDRLGEQREKVREKSREILVKLGAMCLNASPVSATKSKDPPKGVETPLVLFERFLKEVGLGSKVWRVREQVS
jgi:CLIP-associating protein 1/2